MLNEEPAAAMIRETHDILREAMDAGVADSMIPPAMARKLDESLFLFSGFKTAQELKDASSLLRRPDGSVKSFSEFYIDIRSIDDKYNVHYLEAEYNFAVTSSQMAASWAEAEAGGDRYDLQYRTMGDSKVRNEHRALNGVTLPPDDPFWKSYYPPNGWNCRCTVRQVRRDKFPRTDPAEAMQRGDEATDSPKQRIFRFNPGIDGQLFPPKHPYYKVSQETKEAIAQVIEKEAERTTCEIGTPPNETERKRRLYLDEIIQDNVVRNKHIEDVMTEYARMFPEDYFGGLSLVKIETNNRAFMSNSRYRNRPGNILTIYGHTFKFHSGGELVEFNPAKEVRGAFTALKKGQTLTFNQEYAMEGIWHETLHAKAKGWENRMLRNQITVMQMETANQFVARNTYPDFIARFGGIAAHQDEVLERGYGYGTWVRNFRAILEHHDIDEMEAVEALRDKLLNEPYEKVGGYAVEFLKDKGVKNADTLMGKLSDDAPTFKARLES